MPWAQELRDLAAKRAKTMAEGERFAKEEAERKVKTGGGRGAVSPEFDESPGGEAHDSRAAAGG